MIKNQTKIFVKDIEIPAMLGLYAREIGVKQRIRVNIEATFSDYKVETDHIDSTVSYALFVDEIKRIADIQFSLAEKFADHMADFCLSFDRINAVRVMVEKLEICPEGIVGADIIRIK